MKVLPVVTFRFPKFTSIILPVFNESKLDVLSRNLKLFSVLKNCEIICVDGGSMDSTMDILLSFQKLAPTSLQIISLPKSSRAARILAGLHRSTGRTVVIVHPRTQMDLDNFIELSQKAESSENFWGGWRHSFDHRSFVLDFTSWYSNFVRGNFSSIFYLDHCIFFQGDISSEQRELLLEDIPIFEDTLMSKRLTLRFGRGILLKTHTVTSAIRFLQNGSLTQALKNQIAKILFHLGVSPQKINRMYERGLWLNEK